MSTVKEVMTTYPKCCTKHESLHMIVKELARFNIGAMPVIDNTKKVIGIITDRDICLAMANTDKPLSKFTVAEAMTTKVHTCKEDDEAEDALKIMRSKRIGRLPVVDKEGKIKGIITLNSFVRYFHGDSVPEIEYEGNENVLNTLHSIAQRNDRHSFDYYEHWEE